VLSASSLEDGERGRALTREIERRGIPRRVVDEREFAERAGTESPQGVLAVADIPERTLEELRPPGRPGVVLVLDAVQDPGSFGTLVRSAEALGVVGVLARPGTVDPWNPKSIRAAAGSSFRLPVVAASWESASRWLRGEGYEILAGAVGGEAVAP